MDIILFFTQHFTVFLIVVAALSLVIGSFLNVVIYRLPRMMQNEWSKECRDYLGLKSHAIEAEHLNLCLPSSHCPHCKNRLKAWHNIPLISYFILRKKCGHCNAPISMRYPFVEFIGCATSVYVAWHFGVSLQTIAALLFTWILICLTFIDLDYHLLPDHLTLLLLWIGLAFSLFSVFSNSHDAIIGAIVGYLIFAITQWIFKMVTGKMGMGQGDFKLLAALSAYLGWQMIPMIILLASISGMIFGLIPMILKRQFKSVPIPFGPYLSIAGWIALIWGPDILSWYTHQWLMH